MNHLDVDIQEKKTAYKGYFRIERYVLKYRLFNGGWSQPCVREVFERGHAVAVLLYDPNLNKVVLIEQFRIGALNQTDNPWLLELVAGIREPGESSEQIAIRETQEEAGLTPTDMIPVYSYWVSPGGTTEKVTIFCARIDANQAQAGGIFGLEAEAEDIKVWVFDTKTLYEMLEKGEIRNAITIIAIQWLQLHEEKVKKLWG